MSGLPAWHIAPLDPREAPWPLLLDADPSHSKVQGYLHRSTCFAARADADGTVLGLRVLQPLQEGAWELMNIAVTPALQRHGLGGALLHHAIAWVHAQGARRLDVGTGSFGDQLLFYQRAGFRVVGVERDFFVRHYPEPLWERGLRHRDMLRLALDLENPVPQPG